MRNLKFRIKYNRKFQSTYNDRYWLSEGAIGNANLVPENSWNREFGFDVKIKNLNISITAHKLNIFDMIIWQQMDNNIWMPNNIKEVYSRGLESQLSSKFWKFEV